MGDRRPHRRPYFFEIFLTLNLLAIGFLGMRHGVRVFASIPPTFYMFGLTLAGQMAAGLIVRAVVSARKRGGVRAFWRHLNTSGWWSDSARILFFATILIDAYSWIKLAIPIIHPRLFDRALWDLDRTLFFGYSPNLFFLNLFSPHAVLRTFDWAYANIFLASMFLAFGFFLSSPSRRVRVGFMSGMAILWLTGAWLYMLIPSLGPAYYFPDVWFAYSESLQRTQQIQAVLMHNYQNVLRVRAGANISINMVLGVAAFPSMHVAFQTFACLWFRRLWQTGQVIFAIFVLVIFLGSVITGWHYLIDAYAGLLLAVAAYWPAARIFRINDWARLRRLVAR